MKKYKQFFIKTLIIFLITMIVIPASLICWLEYMIGRHNYSKTADYTNYLIVKKTEKAREYDKHGKKIVFFSGSNSLYGINTKQIHQETGLPVLNFGIHMGLEHYIFIEAKKILKPNDIVIMPLEFTYYKKNSETIPSQLAEYLVTYGKDYCKSLNIPQKLGLSFYLAKLIITYHKLNADKLTEKELSQINNYGDFIDNQETINNLQENKKFIEINDNLPKTYEDLAVYDFIQFCKNNNIKLYATMPFHNHKKEYLESEIKAFDNIKSFYENNGVKFLGDLHTGAVYDEKMIYDYGYHANQKGQKVNTEKMLKLLSIISVD